MIRRFALEASSGGLRRLLPSRVTAQIPSFLCSRREFSAAGKPNASQGSAPPEKPSGSGNITKFIIGGVALGSAAMAAYQAGYLGQPHVKEQSSSLDSLKSTDSENVRDTKEDQLLSPRNGDPSSSSLSVEDATSKMEGHPSVSDIENLQSGSGGESQVESGSEIAHGKDVIPEKESDLPSSPLGTTTPDDHAIKSEASAEDSIDRENVEANVLKSDAISEQNVRADHASVNKETGAEASSPLQLTSNDMPKDAPGEKTEPPSPLLDEYLLMENDEERVPLNKKGLSVNQEDLKDAYISKDGKLVLDFIEAIHAAEARRAELDARIYNEEKRKLKEKYEKELKDTRARELMYAEEAAFLDKELNKERAKAIANIKSLQEKAEEKLKMELQHKQEEAELELKKAQDLAKAELAAAIAKEKASQIEKMGEANLHINALCMAFFARSEEARQSHSSHKLAVGALALEDALSKGLPIQPEIDALYASLDGVDRDSLIDLVFSSLPRETLSTGTNTQLQLNQKFDELKGKVRHFSLIPRGTGGMLAHTVAHIASSLKMREDNQSGDGIESVITRVGNFLAEGKLVEAADALEGGVQGSQAEDIICDWVKQARNRAIIEQAITLLRSYATSVSLT